MLWDAVLSSLLLIGAGFTLVGSVGLVRLPDFFSRLHAPTKATTLGLSSMLVASMLHFGLRGTPSLHELLIALFLFVSAPVSAQLLARSALHVGMPPWQRTQEGSPATVPGDGRR
jgi:multicomponent K+:H+ antiporter subunit G